MKIFPSPKSCLSGQEHEGHPKVMADELDIAILQFIETKPDPKPLKTRSHRPVEEVFRHLFLLSSLYLFKLFLCTSYFIMFFVIF